MGCKYSFPNIGNERERPERMTLKIAGTLLLQVKDVSGTIVNIMGRNEKNGGFRCKMILL